MDLLCIAIWELFLLFVMLEVGHLLGVGKGIQLDIVQRTICTTIIGGVFVPKLVPKLNWSVYPVLQLWMLEAMWVGCIVKFAHVWVICEVVALITQPTVHWANKLLYPRGNALHRQWLWAVIILFVTQGLWSIVARNLFWCFFALGQCINDLTCCHPFWAMACIAFDFSFVLFLLCPVKCIGIWRCMPFWCLHLFWPMGLTLRAHLDQVPLNYPSETVVQPSSTAHFLYGFPTVEPLSRYSNKLLSSNLKTAIFQPCKRCHTP